MAQTLHAAGCSSGWLSKARCMVRAAAPYLRIAFIRSADSVPRAEPPRRNRDANRLACGTHARRAATATSKASACAAWPRVRWNGDAPSSGEEGGSATIPDEVRRARRTVAVITAYNAGNPMMHRRLETYAYRISSRKHPFPFHGSSLLLADGVWPRGVASDRAYGSVVGASVSFVSGQAFRKRKT